MSILKLENVGYRYKDAPKDSYVFKNVNYEFEQGKMYAIKGKSGSGKTTLLSLITGLEKCTEGQIFYDQKDLKKRNSESEDLNEVRSLGIEIAEVTEEITTEEVSMDSITSSDSGNFETEEIDLSDFGIDSAAEETPITQDVEEAKLKETVVDYDLSVGNENTSAPL